MIHAFNGTTPRIHPSAFVEDSAHVIGDVAIGENASIWFNTVVRGDVNWIRIGARTNIQDLSMLHVNRDTHPLDIGADVTVGHRVILHGCAVHDLCLIGMGATVLDGVVMETGSMVAAGSVVPPGMTVPAGMLAMGVPAKVVRPLREEEAAHLPEAAQNYMEYAAVYRQAR